MDAEKQKTESRAEHHRKADVFSAAELKVRIFISYLSWAWKYFCPKKINLIINKNFKFY